MKVNEILNQSNIKREECQAVDVYKAADKLLPSVLCPWCNESIERSIEWFSGHEFVIVGETNAADINEELTRMPVVVCNSCKRHVALKPTKVTHNNMGDIYYTGGSRYLLGENIELPEDVTDSIRQYTDRIKNGEDLNHDHLIKWIKYDTERYMSSVLKKHGLKD